MRPTSPAPARSALAVVAVDDGLPTASCSHSPDRGPCSGSRAEETTQQPLTKVGRAHVEVEVIVPSSPPVRLAAEEVGVCWLGASSGWARPRSRLPLAVVSGLGIRVGTSGRTGRGPLKRNRCGRWSHVLCALERRPCVAPGLRLRVRRERRSHTAHLLRRVAQAPRGDGRACRAKTDARALTQTGARARWPAPRPPPCGDTDGGTIARSGRKAPARQALCLVLASALSSLRSLSLSPGASDSLPMGWRPHPVFLAIARRRRNLGVPAGRLVELLGAWCEEGSNPLEPEWLRHVVGRRHSMCSGSHYWGFTAGELREASRPMWIRGGPGPARSLERGSSGNSCQCGHPGIAFSMVPSRSHDRFEIPR